MAPARKKQKLTNGSAAVAEQSTAAEDDAKPLTQDEAAQQRKSLFVRSLPANTTSESLTELFSESYPVKHAIAVLDPATKECRGYGFVTFADSEDAQQAKNEFNGHILDGRKLRAELAEPRHREDEGVSGEQSGKAKAVKKTQDVPQPSRLIVRNLPWTIKTSEQLSKLFMSYGKIKQAYIPQTKRGLMAGFGFVVLRGRKNAEKALEGINGMEIDGRTIAVDWAVSKDVYDDMLKQGEKDKAGDIPNGSPVSPEEGSDLEDASLDDEASRQDGDERSKGDEDSAGEDDVDVRMGEDGEDLDRREDRSGTLFVRNLPFTCTDENLEDHFAVFGNTRYARVVIDPGTDRSKGTGFVCFHKKADADECLRSAPRETPSSTRADPKDASAKPTTNSILQNHEADPTGRYTIDGRVLQISRAVDKSEANRLTEESAAHRRKRNEDKRRLYLLSEGTISSKSKLWEKLSPTERNMREASSKQRKSLIESNPSLHLSLTRLSVRNIPRSVTSSDLKSLAREAVVGFATDVKAGTRQKLSKEELSRGGEDMEAAEKARKKTGKGVVRQAKVVFEGQGGTKLDESSGAGKSRGYGFIEYHTHRNALMGLRWLNGHAIGYQVREETKAAKDKKTIQDRKKRLIVEFAIENAQVVMRRKDKEKKARDRSNAVSKAIEKEKTEMTPNGTSNKPPGPHKRKRDADSDRKNVRKASRGNLNGPGQKPEKAQKQKVDEKTAQRNRIIGRKRALRARKGGK